MASGGSFFISKSALAWSGAPLWVCAWRGVGRPWQTKHGEGVGVWGGGCQPGCIVVYLLWVFYFFIGAPLTTQGWVFPHCSAEQSGHLVLTDTNTRTQRRKHTQTYTHMRRHTVHAACSCCQWCQSWFGQTSLLFHSMNTEQRRRLHLAVQQEFFCL